MGHETHMSQDQLEKKTFCIVILSLYQDGEEGIGWEDVNFFFLRERCEHLGNQERRTRIFSLVWLIIGFLKKLEF
jgi:hypothetical protein